MEFKLLNKNDENRRLTFLGFLVLIFGLFFVPSITAQTQLIPVSDGAFETETVLKQTVGLLQMMAVVL